MIRRLTSSQSKSLLINACGNGKSKLRPITNRPTQERLHELVHFMGQVMQGCWKTLDELQTHSMPESYLQLLAARAEECLGPVLDDCVELLALQQKALVHRLLLQDVCHDELGWGALRPSRTTDR